MAIIAPDIGIDMGTSKTLVYVRKKGVVIDEPTVLVMERGGRRAVRAIGDEALSLLGRTADDVVAVRPLSEGMIRDFDMTKYMLQYFVRKAIGMSRLVKPRAIITVPCRITAIERRAVRQAALYAGVRPSHLHLVEKPFAAAMGCGLPVFQPTGSMVVDIGGGTTEVAVISLGGAVVSESVKIAGDKFDEAIVRSMRKKHNLLLGERTAEELKINIGAAYPRKEPVYMDVTGRNLISGLPKTARVSSEEMLETLEEPLQGIVDVVHSVLERTPPELAADIITNGIVMTGGGSLLYGIDRLLQNHTHVPCYVAQDAVSCVALGTGKALDDIAMYAPESNDYRNRRR